MRRREPIRISSKKAVVCLTILGLPFAVATVGLIVGAVHFFRTGHSLDASMFVIGAIIFGALSACLFALAGAGWKAWRREQSAGSK